MEFNRPKVSIIMPSLNAAPFIRQCILDSRITTLWIQELNTNYYYSV